MSRSWIERLRARFEPAVGSLLLAYDALGIQVTEAIYANLEASLSHMTADTGLFDTANSGPASD